MTVSSSSTSERVRAPARTGPPTTDASAPYSDMTPESAEGRAPADLSTTLADLFYALAAFILEHRRAFIVAVLAGVLVPLGIITAIGPRYTATASFVPQTSGEPDLAGLRGLAGQFGIPLRGGSAPPPPELYAALAGSSMILSPMIADTFRVARGGTTVRVTLPQLFDVADKPAARLRELVLKEMQERVDASVNRRTSAIGLSVTTPWREVSLGIATRILDQLNEFNLRKRQSTARAEREFAERRVMEERARLLDAENALRDFVSRNRIVSQSPTLQLDMERLQRAVTQRQQVLVALEQSYENARVREVQDTPVITVLQQPEALSVPNPRGRAKWSIVGVILAVLLTSIAVQTRRMVAGARTAPSPEARRFRAALAAARRSALGPFAGQPEG